MTNPMLDELLRYERGELEPAAAERVEVQLRSDPEAREWLGWIRGTNASAAEGAWGDGAGPSPMEIAALAEGRLDPEEAARVRRALEGIDGGAEMLAAATGEVDATRRERFGSKSAPGLRVLTSIAAAAVVLVMAVMFSRGDGTAITWEAVRAPMPVAVVRSAPTSDWPSLYRDERWQDAADALATIAEGAPDDGPAWLYLGSARLLAGDDEGALDALEHAYGTCRDSYAVEAAWQLAQARIATGDDAGAEELLRGLDGTRRADDATALLEDVD